MGLTVGFDATAAVTQAAGIGRYTRELLGAMAARDDDIEYRVYYAAGGAQSGRLPSLNRRFRVRALPVSDRVLNVVWQRWRLPLPVQLAIGGIDVFHSPDFALPPVSRRPTILTVHDLAFLRVPQCAYPTLRDYLARIVPRSARSATHLVADSESTRRDIIDLLGIVPERVTTIPLAAAEQFRPIGTIEAKPVLDKFGIEDPYILAAGTIEPRKNYAKLLDAYAGLCSRGLTHRLVIAGSYGWLYESVQERLSRFAPDRVMVIQPNDEDLAALYSQADLFVFPSLYEGFGIPPLEALACGAPVVCSSTSSLPEVVGNAAVTFDPHSVEEIAAAMERVLGSAELSDELRRLGPARAKQFSWSRAAEQTTRLYREVAPRA